MTDNAYLVGTLLWTALTIGFTFAGVILGWHIAMTAVRDERKRLQ